MSKLVQYIVALGAFALVIIQPVHASILLRLVPFSAAVTTGNTVNVNVGISGLGSGGPPSVGAFDLDVGFDASILSPTTVTFGPFLGDPLLFEALTGFDFSTPAIVEFAEVSLLLPSELDTLQPPDFTLATLSFIAIGNGTSPFTIVGTPRVDDAFGAKLAIPEPVSLLLVAAGLFALMGVTHAKAGARDVGSAAG